MDSGISYIENFLRLLGSGVTSIPKGSQWLLVFDDLEGNIMPGIKNAIEKNISRYDGRTWKINPKFLLTSEMQSQVGCVFCQGLSLPGEEITTNPEGSIVSNAFLRSHVGQGRTTHSAMRMSFLDTNGGFAENFLRAWALSTATHGLIARKRGSEQGYRTDMTCYQLGSDWTTEALRRGERREDSGKEHRFALKKWIFSDVCCISVSDEELNYSSPSAPVLREAKFVFNSYQLDTSDNRFI